MLHTLKIEITEMDYVSFGKGSKNLVMIPGLALKGVKDAPFLLSYMYRIFGNDYKVYIIDRKNMIPEGYTVKNIADDVAEAMNLIGIENADIIGVSQGGMVAQYLAIDYPYLVNKLVLGVTLSRENETVREVIGGWVRMTENKDYRAMFTDMMLKMYSEQYIRRYRPFLPLLSRIGVPKDAERFIRLAKACLTCDTYDKLHMIQCPVFVIGGKMDQIVTGEASEEIAEKLKCELYMYDHLGHAAYEEANDFNKRVLIFLRNML